MSNSFHKPRVREEKSTFGIIGGQKQSEAALLPVRVDSVVSGHV